MNTLDIFPLLQQFALHAQNPFYPLACSIEVDEDVSIDPIIESLRTSNDKTETKQQEFQYLREFNLSFDQVGFSDLLSYIKTDIKIIMILVTKNIDLFVPFCRDSDSSVIIKVLENIIYDITQVQERDFKLCRYNNECKYKECCAYVHEIDFQLISKTFKLVQYSANKLIDKKAAHYASGLFRNLSQLEMHIWHLLSRKSYGRKCVSLFKD